MENRRILVVDDESIVALDVSRRIEQLGYSVAGVASSGEEAVERSGEVRPDLVLMDIKMPGKMDGIEAADQIRKQYDIPVVFVTAYGDEEMVQRAKAAEPLGYILKPFDEKDLRAAIELALYKHRMEQQLKQRVRELTALNNLFQKHLTEWFPVVEGYNELLLRLRSVEQEVNSLLQWAESQPIPDLKEIRRVMLGDTTPTDK